MSIFASVGKLTEAFEPLAAGQTNPPNPFLLAFRECTDGLDAVAAREQTTLWSLNLELSTGPSQTTAPHTKFSSGSSTRRCIVRLARVGGTATASPAAWSPRRWFTQSVCLTA